MKITFYYTISLIIKTKHIFLHKTKIKNIWKSGKI